MTIGEYWGADVQIDVVGMRADAWTDLGECKWGTVESVPRLVAELEAKVRRYPNRAGDTVGRIVFTRQVPKAARVQARGPRAPTTWYGLEEMYDAQ